MSEFSLYEAVLKEVADVGEFVHVLDPGELPESHLRDHTASFTTTVSSMRVWSRVNEQVVLEQQLDDAILFAGFQRMSHVQGVHRRYEELSSVASELWILGKEDRRPDVPQAHLVGVGPGPLQREWFLVVLSSRYQCLIAARDLDGLERGKPNDRRFAGLKTFRRSVVESAVEALRGWADAQPLDRELTAAYETI